MTSICQIITEPKFNLTVKIQNGLGQKISTANEPFELLPDWQLVTIMHDGVCSYEIKDITIDGQSIRENLYLSWFTDNNGIDYQPMTVLGNLSGTWSIILHNDISVLKERIGSQLPNGIYGKDLFKEYQWFVDFGYSLKNQYSPQINNFFTRPQGLNLYRKQDYHLYPYIPLTLTLTSIQAKHIETELKALVFNTVNTKLNPGWMNSYIMLEQDTAQKCQSTDTVRLPTLKSWLDSIGIEKFDHIVGYVLAPGQAIEMHKDSMLYDTGPDTIDPTTGQNIYKLHVNVTQTNQSKIKISSGGIMPNGINIINNAYIHAGINEDLIDRYVLTIKNPKPFDFIKNWIEKSSIYFS